MAKKITKTKTVVTTITEEITNEKTQIICILDRSGTMRSIIDDSIGGFNEFLETQKNLSDEATMTVALFDDRYELLYDNVDVKSVKEMTRNVWSPRGMTALYDAIGITINNVRAEHLKLGDEKPAKVLVCIVTDGLENASKEYTLNSIKDLIGECEKDNWNFMYLAANQDAFSVGTSFGVSAGNTFTYKASTDGVKNMSMTMNEAAVTYRSMSTYSADFGTASKNLIDNTTKEE